MKITVYTYRCVNGSCRYIEKQSGVKKAQITCCKCGKHMMLISTEKEG